MSAPARTTVGKGGTVPARNRQDLPVGTVLGIHKVTGPSFAKKMRGRNRYFVPMRCTACKEPIEPREDQLKALADSACAFCLVSPNNDPEERIHVERIWNGQKQVYDRYRFHGRSRDPLHSVWTSMRERCSNPRSEKRKTYSERGITVAPEWDNFLTFAEWAEGSGYAPGLTIDRKNNDLGYTPENCRWISNLENLLNRRRYLSPSLQEALNARASADGVDTYTVIRRALETLQQTSSGSGNHHGE